MSFSGCSTTTISAARVDLFGNEGMKLTLTREKTKRKRITKEGEERPTFRDERQSYLDTKRTTRNRGIRVRLVDRYRNGHASLRFCTSLSLLVRSDENRADARHRSARRCSPEYIPHLPDTRKILDSLIMEENTR